MAAVDTPCSKLVGGGYWKPSQKESGWAELIPPVSPLLSVTPSLTGAGAVAAPMLGTATDAPDNPELGQDEATVKYHVSGFFSEIATM